MNISDYFQDKANHLKEKPAHDIFCRIEGPVVGDMERNCVGRWNAESAGFNTFITNANANGKRLGRYRIDNPFQISPLSLSKTAQGKQGNAAAQMHRTISKQIYTTVSLVPSFALTGPDYQVRVVRDDISRSYERAIYLARDFIYIENQVMRLDDLANWILKSFNETMKKLQVILVLPVVPEEVAEATADEVTFHGQALQHYALTKLKAGLGKNLGLYSLLQNKEAPIGKLAFFKSRQIDVHCKIIVVDDVFASIGSANASPRSFTLDSEINVGWYEPDTVKKFREDLWKEHLGSASGSLFSAWKRSDYVKEWDAIASRNVKAKPGLRQGFVVPHDPDKEKGKKTEILPDFLAQVGHLDQADNLGTEIG